MSTDCNDLNMSMVKNITAHIVKPLKHLCNVSLNTGIFPNQMKIAKVTPIFKSDEKVCLQIRPISLLPKFSKILEKLYSDRLDSFLYKYNILTPSQYGFRSNRPTLHALIKLVEEITTFYNNKYAISIFVEYKKAYGTVNHNILAKKLYFYGIHGVAHKWIMSYLENKSQFVHYEN